MSERRVAILGGTGRLGQAVADTLLRISGVGVLLCSRRCDRARMIAEELNRKYGGGRAEGKGLDVTDREALVAVSRRARLVVIAVPGSEHTAKVIQAAIEGHVDCVDLRFPQGIVADASAWQTALEASGLRYFTQTGHFPGMASVLARYAAETLGADREIRMATAIAVPAVASPAAAEEMVEILGDFRSEVYEEGKWVAAGVRRARRVSFAGGFGRRFCLPTRLSELQALPERLNLRRLSMYLAGANGFVDAFVAPLVMLLRPRAGSPLARRLARLLAIGIRWFASPPFGAVFQVHTNDNGKAADGRGPRLALYHSDSYEFAAAAVVAAVLQVLEGSVAGVGLRFMGHELDPARFLTDVERMGVQVRRAA